MVRGTFSKERPCNHGNIQGWGNSLPEQLVTDLRDFKVVVLDLVSAKLGG